MKFIPVKPRLGKICGALIGAALMMPCGAAPAAAHAFGARYDLPLPLEFYLVGAGAAVALSFVIMAFAFRAGRGRADAPWVDLSEVVSIPPVVIVGVRTVSVGLLFLIVAAGLIGVQNPAENFAPTFVWIIWWVGFAYVAALVGNPWPVINPWSIMFEMFEKLARSRNSSTAPLAYPSWLGVWPAVALFGLFAWFELISDSAKEPGALAVAILIYSCVTWCGMWAFGRQVWLAHGEAFSLAFEVFGHFAPIGGQRGDFPDMRPRRWKIRPYASALVVTRPCRLSVTSFILLMLSTVTFDGLKETPLWSGLLQWIAQGQSFHPIIRFVHDFGLDFRIVVETALLALVPILFLLIYMGFCWLTQQAAGDKRTVTEIAGLFVLSIVPIAIAYHLAHYLSFLLIAGQFIIPLVSDPFGAGWNIFGTADYQVDIGVIGAKSIWYATVIAIIAGHVIAVGVAHFVALRIYDSVGAALRSQVPFLVLMVGYTMVSLWILSQPITGSPGLSYLDAPKGTVSLAPFEFRERCFELTAKDEIQYEFQTDRPVEFDIHYHDGFTIRYSVKRTASSVGESRFVTDIDQTYCLMWFNKSLKRNSLEYRAAGP